MTDRPRDPTGRFSDRVQDYAKYRPGYPKAILDTLEKNAGLRNDHVIADIGSGTGILSALFLDHGNSVCAVEPNAAMREVAEEWLNDRAGFHSVAGSAEATGLPGHSVDYVAVGQGFHWFDAAAFRAEARRILREPGWVIIVWNARQTDSTPFLREYERFLHEFGTDYAAVDHTQITEAQLAAFFDTYEKAVYPNRQVFDFESLAGRVRSSSYTPAPDDPRFKPMMTALEALFHEQAEGGVVHFEYDTELYYGRLEASSA